MDPVITPAVSFFLVFCLINLAAAYYLTSKKRKLPFDETSSTSTSKKDLEGALLSIPPGPTPLPIIGNLHQLAKYEKNPYAGFTELSEVYGSVFALRMGSYPCVVVSNFDDIMEVLIKKGQSFDGRPNFMRWNTYFDGDRQQSLALCDWSNVQKTRRNLVIPHLMFKQDSKRANLFDCMGAEISYLFEEIDKLEGKPSLAKIPISYCAMNVFMAYMCSERFEYSDESFTHITKCFDLIFEDINSGHPTDFLPWLSPLYSSYKSNINKLGSTIRAFLLEKIVRDRPNKFDGNNVNDLLDILLSNHLNHDGELSLDWQVILYALEDLLGGSSAISNVVMRVLSYISQHPNIQKQIQEEIEEVLGSNRLPSMEDRASMIYTEATILETLRHTSSPIVPHVANEDTSIRDIFIEKGTIILINNYELNSLSSLWDKPSEFIPERFIVNNQIKKPVHFMPFSTGKRACIGSKILLDVTFYTIVALLQRYDMTIPEGVDVEVPVGKLAVIGDGFPVTFSPRS